MKKLNTLLLTLLWASSSVYADNLADEYFSKDEPQLTASEVRALKIAKDWQSGVGRQALMPFAGADGSIRYVYTTGQITVLCAVLQVCDVELQAGEMVQGINLGDKRFKIDPAITGSGSNQTLHLLIKPLDVGLDTSLVVTTDRRVYHFRLRSSRNKFMPYVSFEYPENAMDKWTHIQKSAALERQNKTMPDGTYMGNLDFDYKVEGTAAWKPTRVYNNGIKTIIEMPSIMAQMSAPTLLLVKKEEGWFHDAVTQIVNYRVQGNKYIVDAIFDKAILISGVGKDQLKVTITRTGSEKK